MQLADLFFLAAMAATMVTALAITWRAMRGALRDARRMAGRWLIGAATYLAVLLVVSVVQPGRSVPIGADECFDDWCIAVTGTKRHDSLLVVTLRISNHGRGRMQAEPDAYVYLLDASGDAMATSAAADSAGTMSIGDPIAAGEARDVLATFRVPIERTPVGLVKARRARFPGNLIIGDPTSLLHRPTVHALAP